MNFELTQSSDESLMRAVFGKGVSLNGMSQLPSRLPEGTRLYFEVIGGGEMRHFPSCEPCGNIGARLQYGDSSPAPRIGDLPSFDDQPPQHYGVGYGHSPIEAFEAALADYNSKDKGDG